MYVGYGIDDLQGFLQQKASAIESVPGFHTAAYQAVFMGDTVSAGLTGRQLISSLLGHLAVANSVILVAPQIWMTFRKKSGDGVSVASWFIWLIGDILAIIAVVTEGLLTTQIYFYVWPAFADIFLLSMIYWYRYRTRKLLRRANDVVLPDQTPIPSPSTPSEILTSVPSQSIEPATKTKSKRAVARARRKSVLCHTTFIVIVLSIAILVWGVTVYRVRSTAVQTDGKNGVGAKIEIPGFVMGWIMAVLFAGARIPQIHRNWKRKSCEGLSIWLYILIILGNWLLIASVLVDSTDHNYLMANLPLLVGHSWTMVLDGTIMIQFVLYRNKFESRGPGLQVEERKDQPDAEAPEQKGIDVEK